jgi:Domain of unknown function (DUF4350)
MSLSGRTVGIALLVIGIAVAFALRGVPSGDSPEHRTDSDAGNGASALPQLAEALGHPTTTLTADFRPDLGIGVLFVLTPTVGFTRDDARRLSDYVAGGGALVYAAESGDPQLDFLLHVSRLRAVASGSASGAGPMLSGVSRVSGAVTAAPLRPGPDQVVLLRSDSGQPIAVEEAMGRGHVVVLTDPLPLCNGYLEQTDNAVLAAALISLGPAGSRVAFDEYHHGATGSDSPLTGWLSTAWGAAITWAVVALFVGLMLRGRAFGPRLQLPGGGHRSAVEYVSAVGGLLQRSGAGAVTAPLLAAATRRALGSRHGVALGPGFDVALRARAPAAAAELEAAEAELRRAHGDQSLLPAARRLHSLAYPEQPKP